MLFYTVICYLFMAGIFLGFVADDNPLRQGVPVWFAAVLSFIAAPVTAPIIFGLKCYKDV